VPQTLQRDDYVELVRLALDEDVGSGDVTTTITVEEDAVGNAVITQKSPGVFFGHEIATAVFIELDNRLIYSPACEEGEWRERGQVASVIGPLGPLLTGERTALNFMMHLSGVATAAARAVKAVEGTGTRILDTRKTTPGMRILEKAAVTAGGAVNHRIGLFDEILIKENHIAAAGGLTRAVEHCRNASDLPLEVECQSIADIDEALNAGADRLLLDNMNTDELRQAVVHVNGRATLEASGGYTIDTVRAAAETGVNFISMGSITHGAPAMDLSLVVDAVT
jgi:nicotinate-nucleotide pyrophosphorylase (carboxylating)